jgi:hypothetical protein
VLSSAAVILASAARLVSLGPSLPLRLLVGAPVLLAIGLVVLAIVGRRLGLSDLRRPTVAALAAVSVLVSVGLPVSWLAGVSREVGLFEACLLVAAVLGVVVTVALGVMGEAIAAWLRRPSLAGASRGEVLLVGAVLLLFAAIVVRLIVASPVMGFDESIYALTSRWWVSGAPNTGWSPHRSPGISLLGIAAVPFAPAEAPFRLFGLLFGLGALVVSWRLGRELAGPAAGVAAAVAVATIPDFQLNAGAFLTDVPSAALMILLMLLTWRRLEAGADADIAGRGLLLLAPVAAITFYVRYGAAVPIVMVVATVLLLWPRRILRWWRMMVAAAALLLVLLAPHMIFAASLFGAPWSIALSARNLAAPAYLGEALQVYLSQFFTTVAGPIAGGLAVVGIAGAAVHFVWRRRIDRLSRAYLFVLLPALSVGLLLGLVTLAQTRYIYVPLILLAVAGGIAIAPLWRRLPSLPRVAIGTLAFVMLVIAMLNAGTTMVAAQAAYAQTQRQIVIASQRIRADALASSPDGRLDCSVLAYPVPAVTWYSGCATFHFGYPAQPGRDVQLSGPHRYLLLVSGTTIRQPQGPMLDGYLRLVEPTPFATVGDQAAGGVAIRIYRFRGTTD